MTSQQEYFKNDTLALIGYGSQGHGQGLNLRDNGLNVIIGVRKNGASWKEAQNDGWIPGTNLFDVDEAISKGTIVMNLLSDAAQSETWPAIKPQLTKDKVCLAVVQDREDFSELSPDFILLTWLLPSVQRPYEGRCPDGYRCHTRRAKGFGPDSQVFVQRRTRYQLICRCVPGRYRQSRRESSGAGCSCWLWLPLQDNIRKRSLLRSIWRARLPYGWDSRHVPCPVRSLA